MFHLSLSPKWLMGRLVKLKQTLGIHSAAPRHANIILLPVLLSQDLSGQSACKTVGRCLAGTFLSAPATYTSDSICKVCLVGTYQDLQNHLEPSCQAQPDCPPGSFSQLVTLTSERKCELCDGVTGFSTTTNAGKCTDTKLCGLGEREGVKPTRTTDRMCTFCELGQTYMDAETHTNTACKSVAPACTPGFFEAAAPTLSSNRVCTVCLPGTFSAGGAATTCTLCPIGTYQPTEGAEKCLPCEPAENEYQDDTGGISCKIAGNSCTEEELEVPPTSKSNRRCLSPFQRSVVSSVGHFSYVDAFGRTLGVDYLASPKASLGGAALPDTWTLPMAGGDAVIAIAAADTFKVRLALETGMTSELIVDVTYCGELLAGEAPNTAFGLEVLVVDGFTLNAGLGQLRGSGSLSTSADGSSCILLKESVGTGSWTMDEFVLRVTNLPPLLAPSTLRLSRLSVIKVTTRSLVDDLTDPGQRLLVRDLEAPTFTTCPRASLKQTFAADVESSSVQWAVPQAVDNSGTVLLDNGVVYGFDGQEEGVSVSVDALGFASAVLSLERAPYRLAYTAVDGAGNSALCTFAIELDYNATTAEARETLGALDIVRSVATTRVGMLLRHTLVDAGRAGGPLLQVATAIAGPTRLEFVLAASEAVGGGFRLGPEVGGSVSSIEVDLVWAVDGLSLAEDLLSLQVGVDASTFAYVVLQPKDSGMRREALQEAVRLRLFASVLRVGLTGISVKGSTGALPSAVSFGEVVLQLNLPQGRAGLNTSALGFTLQPGGRVSVQQHVQRALTAVEVARAQTRFLFDDSTAPVLMGCPGNISMAAAPGEASASVTWSVPHAVEDVGEAVVQQVGGPAPGAVLGLTRGTGAVLVRYEAFNSAGLEAACSFSIEVEDLEVPEVACPAAEANLTVPAAVGVGSAFVAVPDDVWMPVFVSDNSGETPTIEAPPALELGVGESVLETRVVDGSGNVARCNVLARVVDDTPPTFGASCPESQLVRTVATAQQFFWATPRAQDNDGVVVFEQPRNHSGTAFPQGQSEVVYVARDASGNEAECRFTLTVVAPPTSAGATAGSTTTYGAIGGGIGVFLVVLLVVFVVLRRRAQRKVPADFAAIIETLHLDAYGLAGDDGEMRAARPRELPRESVTIVKEIGKGNFGIVAKAQFAERRGRMILPAYLVAIKQLHQTASTEARNEILGEAAVMAQFEHENVLRLVGVVTRGDPILVVMEFMEHGALQSYIKAHAPELTELQRLGFAADLANGLAYLHARGFIHRDVAARNVLLSSTLTVKLADFGLTRESQADSEYYRSQGGAVPVRWTAPEALEERKFSPASDTFAFGVTVYEIWTDAAMPYEGWTNQRVWVNVSTGYRLPCPGGCDMVLYTTVMLPCWEHVAEKRPRMSRVAAKLTEMWEAQKRRLATPLAPHCTSAGDGASPLAEVGPYYAYESEAAAVVQESGGDQPEQVQAPTGLGIPSRSASDESLRVNYDVAVTSVTDASCKARGISTVYNNYEEPASMESDDSSVQSTGPKADEGEGREESRKLETNSRCDASSYEPPVVNPRRPSPPILVADGEGTVDA